MNPMKASDLDRIASRGCQAKDCDHGGPRMYMHSRCHPDFPTWTFYHEGKLTVECAVCRQPIVTAEVAK